jgi:CheY-like chemotaxis protein
VMLERADGLAHLRITDNGVGIEPDLLKHIFNRLTQGDVSIRRHSGLGLGLAIVRYLVDAHGGSIRAESGGDGQGATFHITLPLVKVTQVSPADWQTRGPGDGTAPIPHPRRLAGRSVLVIENDTATREALADMLRETGALVSTAQSAATGMTLFHELRPEVLLCDIAMPGEDGHTFIRRVRALSDARGGNTPALALTALSGEMHRRRSIEAGFQLYLSKPTDMNRLIEVVARLLEGDPDTAPERVSAGRGSVRDMMPET